MSDAGDIITAILADIAAAITGVTTAEDPTAVDTLPKESLPFAMILETDYDVELLDWGQEQRTWTIAGTVVQNGGTREAMQTKLEAIRAQVLADPTLGGTVDRSSFAGAVPESHPDATRLYGVFAVQAEQVA